jgi:hypothetical protein
MEGPIQAPMSAAPRARIRATAAGTTPAARPGLPACTTPSTGSAGPTFIFDRRFGVSGAHPPQALADAIRQALG